MLTFGGNESGAEGTDDGIGVTTSCREDMRSHPEEGHRTSAAFRQLEFPPISNVTSRKEGSLSQPSSSVLIGGVAKPLGGCERDSLRTVFHNRQYGYKADLYSGTYESDQNKWNMDILGRPKITFPGEVHRSPLPL